MVTPLLRLHHRLTSGRAYGAENTGAIDLKVWCSKKKAPPILINGGALPYTKTYRGNISQWPNWSAPNASWCPTTIGWSEVTMTVAISALLVARVPAPL
jgi:hypothetical protein